MEFYTFRMPSGVYDTGFAWNGLTTVTESPLVPKPSPQYADNIKYLNLVSAEEFGGTIEAFTYPEEFGQCDGTALPEPGVPLGQQGRKMFGLSYRTKVGNDVEGYWTSDISFICFMVLRPLRRRRLMLRSMILPKRLHLAGRLLPLLFRLQVISLLR